MFELQDVDIDKYVVFVDTGVMIPSAIDYVRSVTERYGWNLKVLQPKTNFWEYAKQYGLPIRRRRWCCYRLKLQPIFDFIRTLPPQRGEILGFRKDESPRRKSKRFQQVSYDKRRGVRAWIYLPILDWTKRNVMSYIKMMGLPDPPHYRLGIKETCMCGLFTNEREIMTIKAHYPQLFNKFMEIEGKFRRDWAAFWFGKPCYAKDLAKQKTLAE